MSYTLPTIALHALVVFGGALVLALVLRFARAVLDALPMSRARLALVIRLRPLAALLLIVGYAVIAAGWVLTSASPREWIAFAIILGVATAASWNMLRNVLEGVYLRVGRSFEVGDRVEIAGIQGRVHRLDTRAVVLETNHGQLAIIPYTTVSSSTIRREPFDEQSAFHAFRVAIPADRQIAELKRAVHTAALLCHWSSTRRLPQVTATDDGHLEITVFPIDGNHAPEIEHAVRSALE